MRFTIRRVNVTPRYYEYMISYAIAEITAAGLTHEPRIVGEPKLVMRFKMQLMCITKMQNIALILRVFLIFVVSFQYAN